eukprot:TRINITY_DN55038_c0_g1_i1.p1 TRINITY_DN55038_c0_g1~~TRINITY_DN55038_c0_g1_i1.p1  ORF type:complete len:207 (-),score=13.87 TRINITY_DN55038_c0_g1_i1:136-756(-)
MVCADLWRCDDCMAAGCSWCDGPSTCISSGPGVCPGVLTDVCPQTRQNTHAYIGDMVTVLVVAGVLLAACVICTCGLRFFSGRQVVDARENLLARHSRGHATIGPVGYTGTQSGEDPCTICLDRMPEISLECGHVFCGECVKEWRRMAGGKAHTCPVCREPTVRRESAQWVLIGRVSGTERVEGIVLPTIPDSGTGGSAVSSACEV